MKILAKSPLILTTLLLSTVLACSHNQNKTDAIVGAATANTNTAPIAVKAASDLIPLRDFFKNAEKARFEISPNGEYISFMQPWKNRMNIFVQKLSSDHLPTGEIKQITFAEDRDLSGYFWKENDTILYSKDFKGDENFHVFAVDIASGKQKDLTDYPKTRAGILDDLDDISTTDILVELNKRNPEIFDVYRINVKTGETKMVAENPGRYTGWDTDHNGVIRLATESDGLTTTLYYRDNEQSKFAKVISFDYKSSFDPLFFDFDNKNLYASSNLGRDKSIIVLFDPKTGKELKTIFSRPDVDVSMLGYSKKRKVITAAIYTTWKEEFKFFDKTSEARMKRIRKELPDYEIFYSSHNKDETLFTVVATNDKTRGLYYLYDDVTHKLTFIANVAPWLDSTKLASTSPIEYKSRDGLTIHGYLTVPHGMESAQNLPVIVNPHGGPWVRDSWSFDPEVQFLASRGYAVFQPNYRGSTGYGKKFVVKSFKEWGRTMQDDLTDGVAWLIKKGYADPKRVGIYGGSYGGYATLAGLAFTPDLYACGVDYVGVSNLLTFMNTMPPYWKPEIEKMYAMVGNPKTETDMLKRASPVFSADKIKAPLFVAQGAQDPRVNIAESNQIVESLRKRGVAVQYLVKDNEGHGFHNEENRFDFYEQMEAFLKKHM